MGKILIIDDDPKVYRSIKETFNDWEIIPENHDDIPSYSDENSVKTYAIQAVKDGVDAIIIDIELTTKTKELNTSGLNIIGNIRQENTVEHKIIPIYCYSVHTNYRQEALIKGATNFFDKNIIGDNEKQGEIEFLKNSLTALTIIYGRALGMTLKSTDTNTMMEILMSIKGQNSVLLQSMCKLLSLNDITSITELNEENYNQIVEAIGGESNLQELKKEKYFDKIKDEQIALVDDIANILSDTQILAPFAAVLRGFKLLVQSTK